MSKGSSANTAGLRRAKTMLAKRCQKYDWFTGVGIVPTGDSMGLRVSAREQPESEQVPATYYGYPVQLVVVRRNRPRG